MLAGTIDLLQLDARIYKHLGMVESLAKSAMNGSKPEREEVLLRLTNVNHGQSSKLV